MNITELIERLQDIAEDHPNAEIALAVQPSYPLRESLRGVAFAGDETLCDLHDEQDHDDRDAERDPFACEACQKLQETVWLVSGGQSSRYEVSPYAPGWVFEACER